MLAGNHLRSTVVMPVGVLRCRKTFAAEAQARTLQHLKQPLPISS
jgi:hypothetical protein